MKNRNLKSILSITGYFLLVIALCVSASLVFHNLYYELIYVSGNSMSPTLNGLEEEQAGTVVDFGIMDTHQSALKNIKRFSIVSTYFPYEEDYDLVTGKLKPGAKQKIKRVIALPGETFKIEQSRLYVLQNNEFNYIPYTFQINEKKGHSKDVPPIKLKDDEYWVLGDNRDNSKDSGYLNKAVTKDNLIGVLVAIEGKAKLKIDHYICPACGKIYKNNGVCSEDLNYLEPEYDLVNKQYRWPKYF